ncbi:hypothetical protein NIA69_03775 [Gemmiger formicilis]|nr:hypothetical protein [Gemmiger formicilis]
MALVLCSCSTAASNANRYFTSVGAIATNLMNSGKVSNGSTASAASENTAAALPTPGDFTMSEDGTYSFTGVDGAGYYLLYFCEPGADPSDDSFIYTSEPINAVSGTTTYTGSYLDVMQAAYGEYQARVVAFPAVGDTTSSMSSPRVLISLQRRAISANVGVFLGFLQRYVESSAFQCGYLYL